VIIRRKRTVYVDASGHLSHLGYTENAALARDLKLLKPKDYQEMARRTIEFKRMLAALIQKLNASCRERHARCRLRVCQY
jgi:hypothetical protein